MCYYNYYYFEMNVLLIRRLIVQTTLTALGEMFEAARSIMSWLGECAKVRSLISDIVIILVILIKFVVSLA